MKELNLSYRFACLHCSLSDKEINEYIQEKKRSTGLLPVKYAVSHVGIQDDGTWILGANVCISPKGEVVSAEDCCHTWIGDLYSGVGVAAASNQRNIELPLTTDPLRELLSVLEVTAKHNFLPCLLTIAGMFFSLSSFIHT